MTFVLPPYQFINFRRFLYRRAPLTLLQRERKHFDTPLIYIYISVAGSDLVLSRVLDIRDSSEGGILGHTAPVSKFNDTNLAR